MDFDDDDYMMEPPEVDTQSDDDEDYDSIFKCKPVPNPMQSSEAHHARNAVASTSAMLPHPPSETLNANIIPLSPATSSTAVSNPDVPHVPNTQSTSTPFSSPTESSTNASLSDSIVTRLQPIFSGLESAIASLARVLALNHAPSVPWSASVATPPSSVPSIVMQPEYVLRSLPASSVAQNNEPAPSRPASDSSAVHNVYHSSGPSVSPAAPAEQANLIARQGSLTNQNPLLPTAMCAAPTHDTMRAMTPASDMPSLHTTAPLPTSLPVSNLQSSYGVIQSAPHSSLMTERVPVEIDPLSQQGAPHTPAYAQDQFLGTFPATGEPQTVSLASLVQLQTTPSHAIPYGQMVPLLGMRSQVPAPLLDILGTRESLVPCPASISSDYNASSARNPPSPTGTPQNAQSPENELNNELKQQGKRARSTDMDSGYPYKRSKVQTPTPGIEEQPAVLPSIIPSSERSSFLPPSMLRRSPSSSLHRGPLAPVQASVQLQQELIGLPFHVAYEVFRLANSFLSVEEILAQHKQLQALHKACDVLDSGSKHGGIVKVINCLADLLPREKRHTFVVKTKVWQTLADEKALQGKGDSLELGNPNEMKDHRFGGRVRFRAVLSVAKDAGSKLSSRPSKQPRLTVELKAPTVTVGNSNRLTRLYGSDAFLCVKIDDPSMKRVDPAYLRESLCEGILLGNDLYHAWFIKDGTALFINTAIRNKILSISHLDSDEFFIWFIDRHNPPGLNQRQTVGKWAKRMQLLWSSSVPGPRLDAADIQPEEDKIAPSYRHLAKPPAEGDMTDGAGLMTWAVARDIQARLGLRFAPCALQVRLAGKKGMVSRCPPSMDVDGVRRVWVRPSQGKIKYGEDQLQDPSLCTIDVLSPSSFSAPARITTQLVVLLAENGVPNTVLVDLMVKSLKTSLQPFFEKESKPLHMACALEDLCHLMVQRLSKAGSLLRGASVEEISEDDDEFEDHPGSYEESAYLCFLSGFALKGSAYLRRKVRDVIKKLIQCTTNDIRFKLERCVDGRIIPDPTGKLAPGEIFVQFRREYDVNTIESVKILTGDVLITRHPCKLPTDIQKMRAVDIDELHYMYDVIVMSTQGERSPASMLGGGDYDGDRATVVWEPQLVEPFKNADPGFADQPKDFESFLDRDLTTVASLIDETRTWGAQAKRLQIQKYLLSDLNSDFQMQGYSTRHDVALYLLGASHPKAVEFAHKYMVSLDSSKTGVKVKASVYASKEDREYDRQHPWKPQDEKSAHKFALGPRPAHLAKLLSKYDLLYSPKMENGVHVSRDFPLDKDLRGPWEEFERRQGEKLDIVRRAIMAHVKEAYYKYKAMNQEYARAQDAGIALTRTRTDRIKEVRQFYRSGPRESTWKGVMSADECAVYKASYCYLWDMQQEGNKRGDFPFEVDHWTICSIKARANSTGAVAITTSAYKVLRVDSRLLSTTTNIDYDNE